MKRIALKLLPLMMVLLLVSCSSKTTEKVVETYDSGAPATVRLYEPNGECRHEVKYYEDGAVMMEGDMKGDLREGEWKSYFPDGKVQSVGLFKDGIRYGKATVYYPNGNLYMEGYYVNGTHSGEWTYYDEQGYKLNTVNYGN